MHWLVSGRRSMRASHDHMQEQMGRQQDAVLYVSLLDGSGRGARDSDSLAIVFCFLS